MKVGNHIRDKKKIKDINKKKVQNVKMNKESDQMALPITTKQIDGGMLLDPDVSTQRSSTGAFYSADKHSAIGKAPSANKQQNAGFALKRGRSQ